MTAPSDFSFLVPRFSFLVSRWRCDRALSKTNGAFECGRNYEFRLGNSVRVLVRLVFTSRELEMKTAARVGTRMYEFMRSNNS